MSIRALHESAGNFRATEGGKWSATLITPGTGSSGVYAEEMLAESAPVAFKKGMKLWWGHPKGEDGPGDRDARDQWGVLDEDATYEPGEGVVGKIRLLPHWKDVVESLGDQASLSVYVVGEHDEDGNVTALLEHATNSVDIVSYPGREGSGLKKKLEAARAASPKPAAASAQESNNKQEERMDAEELKAVVKSIVDEALTPIKTFLANEDARRQAEADAAANTGEVTEAVEAAVAAVESVKAAKLLPKFEAKLIEAAKRGDDISDDFEFAKEVTAEAHASTKDESADTFYVHESAAENGDDLTLNLGGRL